MTHLLAENAMLRISLAERAARAAQVEAERDALADALRKYGEHRRDCLHRYLRTCDCGFSAALDPNRDTRP